MSDMSGSCRLGGIALLLAILAVGLGVAAGEARAQATDDWVPVTIIYNSDVQGAIEQCGCRSNPRGGVARRATILDQAWNEGKPVLMLDGGDLFGRRSRVDREQTRYLCRWTSEFGYDAIALGEFDLNYGVAFLREMVETYQLPFTNANVRDPESGELLLPEFLLIERGGITFGVVSVMDPEVPVITTSAQEESFQIDDPVEALQGALPRMREAGAQTIVLLSHMGDSGSEALLAEVPGVDICLVCHTTGYVWIGGYDDRPPANKLRNVQCEACHGYGTLHRRDGSMRQEARESCVTCHDQENSPEFDYGTYWAKIAH